MLPRMLLRLRSNIYHLFSLAAWRSGLSPFIYSMKKKKGGVPLRGERVQQLPEASGEIVPEASEFLFDLVMQL